MSTLERNEQARPDMVGRYLIRHMKDYVFLEWMPEHMLKPEMGFMKDIPIPVKKTHLSAFAEDKPIQVPQLVLAMVNVIGMDPSFRYVPQYIRFLTSVDENVFDAILKVGIEQAKVSDMDGAAIHLRAALAIKPNSLDAMYHYILVCRRAYLDLEGKEHVAGNEKDYILHYKAEVLMYLELLTQLHPEFPMGYYYLGFSYLNAGQYTKAKTAWDEFLVIAEGEGDKDLSEDLKDEVQEIRERVHQLRHPVQIEKGYMLLMSQQWQDGIAALEAYKDSDYMNTWWPLPYYLGVGYNRLNRSQEAIAMLKQAIRSNPSGPEIMAELVIAYKAIGDEENAEKYLKKIELVKDVVVE